MKILWLCNIILPKIAKDLSKPASNSGGWLVGLSEELLRREEIQLYITFPIIGETTAKEGSVDSLSYFGFPVERNSFTSYDAKHEQYFASVIDRVKPDIIHVFGTELPSSLAMVNACRKAGCISRLVIHIQGLASVYAKHFYAGLPEKVVKRYTLFDFILQNNIKQQKMRFGKRGFFEVEALKNTQHVIGRTDWDKACITQINRSITYHFCNEVLRDSFYHYRWDINACEKHSIFISQASYPIKGFHFMLEAMPIILQQYPKTHIYVAGLNILANDLKSKLKRTSYSRYLKQLIHKYGLKNHITFVGSLTEQKMCEQYLKAHVFVSPSIIENSPNSVGEAMMLGVPTVASDVGGVKNMLTHGRDGFIYPHDEPYMLAYYVCCIFNDDSLADRLSSNAVKHASITHNREKVLDNLLAIYKKISD